MQLPTLNKQPEARDMSGINILRAIARLIQTATLYGDNNNKMIINAVNTFKQELSACGNNSQSVSLQISKGRFLLQEKKLPMIRKNAQFLNQMLTFFEKRSIYGFHFVTNLKNTSINQIIEFVRLMDRADQYSDPFKWLKTEMEKKDIRWLDIISKPPPSLDGSNQEVQIEMFDTLEQKKTEAKKTYHYALNSVKEVAEKLLSGKEVSIRKSVRMIQRMIDNLTEDSATFLALSTIRIYDDYTFSHSLNVAILAMLLGKNIGMKRELMEELGLCGLFHDLGKITIPRKILNKEGKLNDSEYNEIRQHSLKSAMLILNLKTDSFRKEHLLISPLEHHIKYDHTGYPSVDKKNPVSLFGRILTIVDVYDAITSPRIYRSEFMSPDEAIQFMLSNSGRDFDPLLLKVFVNMLGVFPIGTFLKLDTGEKGIALQNFGKAYPARPMVQILNPGVHTAYRKGTIVNLAERDPETGQYLRNVIETEHPAMAGIQPANYIL